MFLPFSFPIHHSAFPGVRVPVIDKVQSRTSKFYPRSNPPEWHNCSTAVLVALIQGKNDSIHIFLRMGITHSEVEAILVVKVRTACFFQMSVDDGTEFLIPSPPPLRRASTGMTDVHEAFSAKAWKGPDLPTSSFFSLGRCGTKAHIFQCHANRLQALT